MDRHMYHPSDGSKDPRHPADNIMIQESIFSEGHNMFHHAFGSTMGGTNRMFM